MIEKLTVEGMSCSHCQNAITNGVSALAGVKSVDVSLENKLVTVEYDPNKVDLDKIKAEISEQGFEVV